MNPIHLNERALRISHRRSEIRVSWPDGASLATPFWLGESLVGDDSDRFFDEPFPYRAIAYSPIHRAWIAVRTDAYPLMWLWHWAKYRWDETLEVLLKALVFTLEVWGLAYCHPCKIPRLDDIGKRSPHPTSYPKRL